MFYCFSAHPFRATIIVINRSQAMDTYQLNFTGLLGLCAALFVAQRKPAQPKQDAKPTESKDNSKSKQKVDGNEASQWPFLVVFALVMGSDWLQARLHNPRSEALGTHS